ncbi:hypothetical protein Lste_1379 [Legionella steelei]|uniref:MazG-related protein n=1 Tax=Legionella steelei TaxID=947033 RepID=A0A0W0ZG32_9GAMM|nr:hypothetical protein [Legionella steelei]KTD68221.1 hypothetical protein Lste_1379 [Legionella steelei]
MQNIKAALIWITDILKKHHVLFQITGGLAARAYGATRPIEDIDIDIPEDKFDIIKNEVAGFITYGPDQFKSNTWDLLLMTLNYQGQVIDLSGAYQTKIFNGKTGLWQGLSEDLSKTHSKNILGLQLPVIPLDVLIAYKEALSREVDIIDIQEIAKVRLGSKP